MKTTIIIPHHNRHDLLKECLEKIDNSIFNIIIVSGSYFAYNCNKGAKLAEDKMIFLNDDTLPSNDDLQKISDELDNFDFIGSTQITGNNMKYWGIGIEERNGMFCHGIQFQKEKSLFPSAFCLGIRKKNWDELNGFDLKYINGNEDVDLGFRAIEKGLKIKMLDLEIKHLESQSANRFDKMLENENLIYRQYSQEYLKNLYENPNIMY